ncbi:MAG TPA: hypothetical protein VJ417_15045 [Candidatus Glassbacteria bacterium]|nr:hypothetical protein [Candidatus Glassbacteria bacterium]
MSPVYRTASRVAWPVKKQTAFGTPLAGPDLTGFLRLADPLIIDESAEHWTDRGAVGAGHEWPTQAGKLRQYVRFEIPLQPLPVSFIGYLLALLFSADSSQTLASGAYEHVAGFQALASRPEAYVSTLAIHEDGSDYYIQDAACTGVTLRGEGTERLQAGASFVGSRIGGTLAGYTWPAAAPLRYLYNYAGAFSIAGDGGKRSQLRGFSLTLNSGIGTELAWRKAAAEADRIYPSVWLYTPERSLSLSLSMIAESGDLAAFRAAQQGATQNAIVLSCLGEKIPGSSPDDYDEIELTLPKAVFSGLDYAYEDGLLNLDLDVEAAYDSATGGPISVKTVEGGVADYFP